MMSRTIPLDERILLTEEYPIQDVPLASFFVQEIANVPIADLRLYYEKISTERFDEMCRLLDIHGDQIDTIRIRHLFKMIQDFRHEIGVDAEMLLKVYSSFFFYLIYYPSEDNHSVMKSAPRGSAYILANFVRVEFWAFLKSVNYLRKKQGMEEKQSEVRFCSFCRSLSIGENSCADVGTVLSRTFDFLESQVQGAEKERMHGETRKANWRLHRACQIAELVFETIFQPFPESGSWIRDVIAKKHP